MLVATAVEPLATTSTAATGVAAVVPEPPPPQATRAAVAIGDKKAGAKNFDVVPFNVPCVIHKYSKK